MANFVLLKNLVSNPNVSGELNNGFSWIQKNNEVWCSEKGRINYSSDFGVSFINVYNTDSVSPGSKDEDIWLYEHNDEIFSTGNEVKTGNEYHFRKWNTFTFDNLLEVVVANAPITYLANVEFSSKHYIVVLELGTTNDIKIYEQSGDTISLLQTIVGAGASVPVIAIFEFQNDLYLLYQIGFTDSEMFKLVGASFVSQFTTGGILFAAGEFGADAYYYERSSRDIGTINMVTGALTPITTIAEAAQSFERSYFREVSGDFNLIIGTAVNIGAGSRVYVYAFNGAIFTKTYEKTNSQIGDAVETASKIIIGQIGNEFFENECNIFYEGFSSTNETNANTDDGTITHDVNTDNAVGTVEYRLLDQFEVEVVTWQVAALFENLVPGVYLLEARDDDCSTRFSVQVSILEFQSSPLEQQASRSRDYLNSPNFTRYRQIFGMTLSDFQALNGELPPPIDEVLPVIPETFVYSVTVGAAETISLPMLSGDDSLYDFTVNFGDGTGDKTVTAYADPDRQHTYAGAGTFDIIVKRVFDYILFADSPDSIVELKSFNPAGVGEDSFLDCSNLIKISAINIPSLIRLNNLNGCFMNCSALVVVNISINSWNVSAVTDMASMFDGATFFNQAVDGWDVGAVTTMSSMFRNASAFNQLLNSWNVAAVTNMSSMFRFTSAFNGNIISWNVGLVTTMSNMFEGATVFNQNIDSWNVGAVTNMSTMFSDATLFNRNIGSWNVGAVTNMSVMFDGAIAFNQSLNSWDVSAVINMSIMFRNANAFNGAIGAWVVSAVTNMSSMFDGADVFNQSLNSWDVSIVTNMGIMFRSCPLFNGDISSWNVGAVTSMASMFRFCTVFNVDISSWNVGAVTIMSNMIESCTAFNQDISGWNVGNVTTMASMFANATAFDQDISSWNITSITTMASMFLNVTLSTLNYDAILDVNTGWPSQAVLSSVSFHAGNSTYTQTAVDSGTTDATTANKLVDSTQNFLTTVSIGDIAHNTTDGTFGKVTAIDSDTTLSVSNDVFPTGKAYVIQSSDAAKGRFELSDTNSWTITDGGAV
jgi:surface protein